MPVWLVSLISHWGFKAASIFLLIALVGVALFSWSKLHDAKIRAEAMAKCPPQLIASPGSTIKIDQRISKMACFPIPAIGHFGLGLCHD